MSRIPYPTMDQLSEAKRAYASAPDRRLINIARMAMHTPDALWRTQLDFATQTVFGTTIDDTLREILILRVAALSRCEYELFHHRSIARNLGFDGDVVEAIIRGEYATLSERERAVARFTSEVVTDVAPSDEALAAVRAHFPPAQIFEMVALIGGYMMTARVVGVGGVEIDDHAIQSWTGEQQNG